jgi:hypothetical protein
MHRSLFVLSAALLVAVGFVPLTASQESKPANTMKLEPDAARPKAKIADLAWIQGRWVGEGLGGTVEEIWSPPIGDSMLGMFRLV